MWKLGCAYTLIFRSNCPMVCPLLCSWLVNLSDVILFLALFLHSFLPLTYPAASYFLINLTYFLVYHMCSGAIFWPSTHLNLASGFSPGGRNVFLPGVPLPSWNFTHPLESLCLTIAVLASPQHHDCSLQLELSIDPICPSKGDTTCFPLL